MPFKPVEVPKCPVCSVSVYAAEERIAGGNSFHAACFKCSMCNKLLDSTNCSEHEGQLFCCKCHGRRYGPKGYGFGGGAGTLCMDTGAHLSGTGQNQSKTNLFHYPQNQKIARAPDGEGCPRCGGCVYQAEQVLAKGKPWHKHCFHCADCNKKLDSLTHNDGPDGEIYCKLNRAHIQGGFSSGWVGPMLQLVTSMKKIDDFKLCYSKQFGPKGYGYGQGAGALQMSSLSLDPTVDGVLPNKPTTMSEALIQAPPGQGCPRCGGAVFEAEKMQSRFRNYHRKCFNCKECNSTLDSTKACDGPDKDVYCKLCYSKKYGPKGYGFGCGAAFLQSDAIRDEAVDGKCSWSPSSTTSIKAAPGEGCPRCGGAVFAAELMLSKGKEWHRSCFTCRDCKRPLDSTIACDGPDHEIYCKQDYARRFGLKGFGFGHAPTLVSGSVEDQLPNNGMVLQPSMGAKAPPGEGCPRCGFFVYAAEKMPVKNRTYHRKCFNCNKCHKSLDSTNACDSPDEEIYCRTCYGRLFGPKGVGYGLGAGVLSMG